MKLMKRDPLYLELHKIIEDVRFMGRMVLAVGPAQNVAMMRDYLKCYGLEFTAALDDDWRQVGKSRAGLPVYSMESVLQPMRDNALVLVFASALNKNIKEQFEAWGYKEQVHFFLLHDLPDGEADSRERFSGQFAKAVQGKAIYNKLKTDYGEDTHIFFMRGATGDVFLNGLYLASYCRKLGISNYAVVGDAKGLKRLAPLFGWAQVAILSHGEAEAFQFCYTFWRQPDVTDLFMWENTLPLNKCRLRMQERFTFLDTYQHFIYRNLVSPKEWQQILFLPLSEQLRKKYQAWGMREGRTVIVSPNAYSVKKLPEWFWDKVAAVLQDKGYKVFVNLNPATELNPFNCMQPVFFPYEECEAVLKFAGHFVALRSGLCDIVAQIPCRQVILYPAETRHPDYSVHRSSRDFAGLGFMCNDKNMLTELESPVIEDLLQVNDILDGWERLQEYQRLLIAIAERFEPCGQNGQEK